MTADFRFAQEIALADSYGIPRSILIGRCWPNPVDDTEPQWLTDDTDEAIAYRHWRGGVCPSCGIHERDCGDGRTRSYEAAPTVCHTCVELVDAADELNDHDCPQAIRFRLVPIQEVNR